VSSNFELVTFVLAAAWLARNKDYILALQSKNIDHHINKEHI